MTDVIDTKPATTLSTTAVALTPALLRPMMPILVGVNTLLILTTPFAIGISALLISLGAYDLYTKRNEVKKILHATKNNEPLLKKPLTRWDHIFNFAQCGLSLLMGGIFLTALPALGTVAAIGVGAVGVGATILGGLGLIGNTMYVTEHLAAPETIAKQAAPETGEALKTAPLQADFKQAVTPEEPKTKAVVPEQDNELKLPKIA